MKTETIKKLLAEFKDLSRYSELQGLKVAFQHLPDGQILDQQHVELLKTYLKNRWTRLKKAIQQIPAVRRTPMNTRPIYLNMGYSVVDVFCITVARELAVPDKETKEVSASSNFYKLLMPGIENDFDITFTEPVWSMPCTQLLLTEDWKFLIPIENIYEYYVANKVLVNPLTTPAQRLTPNEIKQFEMLFQHSGLYRNYKAIKHAHDTSTSWVTLTTIQKLKDVLDSYEDAYTRDEDFKKATAAYDDFNNYVQSLLPEEQDALNRLPLDTATARAGHPTFGLLMSDVNDGAECVTHNVRAKLARLVYQHMPCDFKDASLNSTMITSVTSKKALTLEDTIPTPPPYDRYCEPLKTAVNAAIVFHPQIKLAKLKTYHEHLGLLNDQLQPLLDEKKHQQLKNVLTSDDRQSLLLVCRYLQSGLIFLKEGPLNQFYGSFLSLRRKHGNNESRTYKMVHEVYCQLANILFTKYELQEASKVGKDLTEKLKAVVCKLEAEKTLNELIQKETQVSGR